jgi:DNA invertase Pin-like site-specific DNA recombinase
MSDVIEQPVLKRCAVYCRVSSDERLDQTFNSIDAQREAGAAFIASQRAEGWMRVDDSYEDPGFSGGNMERPGLKRLMRDIQDGKIDIVVVYKIDRLSRSLADFATMVEVSFSSVTQQINSATSMGRLMLNVLLSFAQFEREVTGERIRDKIAASKRKGMWMGGPVPLGYRVESRQLVVVPEEAQLVRGIFASFISSRSTTKMVKQLAEQGAKSKSGKSLSKQTIYKILHNRMYLGELGHKGEYFRGQHEALIDQATWDQVQAILSENSRDRARDTWGEKCQYGFLLRGMVFTMDGDLYLPMATRKPSGKVYRYYVVNKNQNMGAGAVAFSNLPAGQMEKAVMEQVLEILRSGQMVHQYWKQISVINPELSEPEAMVLFFRNTATIWNKLATQAKQDIVRTLIKRVTVTPDGIDLQWRYETWGALMGTPPPNTVGHELLELETA